MSWLLAVAVMPFVVQREDVLHSHQIGHHALDHLPLGLQRIQRPAAALQQGAAALGKLHAFPPHERMVVGNDDLRVLNIAEHVAGDKLAAQVVVVRVVGQQDAQPVTDRQAGGHDQEAARELLAVAPTHGIDRLPRDDHRHDGRLAGACG